MQEISIQCLTVAEEGSALKDVGKQKYRKACLEIEISLWRYRVSRKTERHSHKLELKEQKPNPSVSMPEKKNWCHVLFLKSKENEQTWRELRIKTIQKCTTQIVI